MIDNPSDQIEPPVIHVPEGTAPITPEMVHHALEEDYAHAWTEWSSDPDGQTAWGSD